MTDQTSEVMRVLDRLRACDLSGFTEDELLVLGEIVKDIRPVRNRLVLDLHRLGWTYRQMATRWDVDPATPTRWADEPTERRPGERQERQASSTTSNETTSSRSDTPPT